MLASCETRDDEPSSAWERVFDAPPPSGVTLRHGHYWRSGHWSSEWAWAFEIEAEQSWIDQAIENSKATLLPNQNAEHTLSMLPCPIPNWFSPAGHKYQVYQNEHFVLLTSLEDKTVFLTDCLI